MSHEYPKCKYMSNNHEDYVVVNSREEEDASGGRDHWDDWAEVEVKVEVPKAKRVKRG